MIPVIQVIMVVDRSEKNIRIQFKLLTITLGLRVKYLQVSVLHSATCCN